MKRLKDLLRNLGALSVGLLVAFVLCEIVLRIYNPFPSRVRGDKIQLPANLNKTIEINPPIAGLDSVFNYSVNSIGLRGEEPPADFDERYTIFTVGGSTTECSMLDDEKTWPEQLAKRLKTHNSSVWLNNAGIDGCSTYGHAILVEDHLVPFKPDMILFLVGVNDRGKATFESENGFLKDRDESFVRSMARNSEVLTLATNLWRSYKAHQVNLGHGKAATGDANAQNDGIPAWQRETEEERQEQLAFHRNYLPSYRERVKLLIKQCKEANITPVIVTQPLMDHAKSASWQVMALYNQTAIETCAAQNVPCIDLGTLLEKQPEYYYDSMHFTNEGAARVAELLNEALKPHIPAE